MGEEIRWHNEPPARRGLNTWMVVGITAIVTAILIGGGVYWWKEKELEKVRDAMSAVEQKNNRERTVVGRILEKLEGATNAENDGSALTVGEVTCKYEPEIMALDGVFGIGIGKCDDEDCIVVHAVREKEANINQVIPDTIEGYRVKVEGGKLFEISLPGANAESN